MRRIWIFYIKYPQQMRLVFKCFSCHGCRFALPVVIDIFPLQGK